MGNQPHIAFTGTVARGRGIGAKLGFPTVNLFVENRDLPVFGVYASRIRVRGKTLPGVTNVGVRPTVGSDAHGAPPSVETYIFDFSEDVYGEEITVVLEKFLREEKKFGSAEELAEQVRRDMENAKNFVT